MIGNKDPLIQKMFKLVEDGYYGFVKDMAEGKPTKHDLTNPD